jgi:hypothetical protein
MLALVWVVLLAAPGVAPTTALADATTTWTAGPNAVGDTTYDGFIDAPAAGAMVPAGNFLVSGWFVDTTAQGWAGADDLQVFLGQARNGGSLVAHGVVGQDRPDVAAVEGNPYFAAAGFSALIPADALPAGPQTLSVYVHTPAKGWWYKQVAVNVAASAPAVPAPAPTAAPLPGGDLPIVGIERPKDSEVVYTSSIYHILGYALDRAAQPNQGVAGSGVDRVEVYLDNPRESGGIFLGDANLGYNDAVAPQLYGGQFESAGWELDFKATDFHANTHLLFAYAHSAVTGREDVAQRYFAIRE